MARRFRVRRSALLDNSGQLARNSVPKEPNGYGARLLCGLLRRTPRLTLQDNSDLQHKMERSD
jgi:hypothetical protein